ncbi:MAG TPA: D-2-hydroxyacid dehydrogenase [bacterium]|nr:D-2-hydroxyacid dehydrogenase [bacterium]
MPREGGGGGRPCVVAVPNNAADRHVAQIEAVDPRVRVVRITDRKTWLREAPEAEVVMGFRPLREGTHESQHLRWVHALGAGVENLCQDVAGTEILVTNNHIHADAIADHVFAFLLTHTRRMREAHEFQTARRWVHTELVGTILAGRTMGILGLGTIGRGVARRAEAFGMRVVGTKRRPEPIAGVAEVHRPEDTDGVLRQSAVLVIALPLTPATRRIVGARDLALMPEGAFVINIGRGGLVDEDALVAALRSGRLGGAGFDVFEQEPLPPDNPLWDVPGLIVTPHVSGDFPGYLDRMVPTFCENLRRYLAGQPLLNVVDPALGY